MRKGIFPDERITDFIFSHTCLTLAVAENNVPYCASCFYVYVPGMNILVIKSKKSTAHIRRALLNPRVAGAIVPDSLDMKRVQGIQFSGILFNLQESSCDAASMYYRKYPFAIAVPGELWGIELSSIKFTDHRLGFGKKLYFSIDGKNSDG